VTCPANCPACGAPLTPKPDIAGYQCDYCHAVFYPGEEDDGVQVSSEPADPSFDQACPLCNQTLVHATIAKMPLLYCTECHGLLMRMGTLPDLVDALRATNPTPAVQTPPDQGDLKRVLQCPQCHCRMDTHFYAGPGNVIVDSCGNCFLIWLDGGELMRIVHAPDAPNSSESGWE
jgi:Zn-finger nucleic acid-binding protein